VCPCMAIIEEYRHASRHEEGDGRDRGMMRLRVGIEDDVDLDTPLMGAHQRPSQPRRVQEIRV